MSTATSHDPKAICRMTCHERANYVRNNDPNWGPIKMQVTRNDGKPATLMADANGDCSLWSLTDGYTGSLSLHLLDFWPWGA